MTNTLRKKITTTNLAFWLVAVLVTSLLVFVPTDGRAANFVPVAVAVCGWVSMLSMKSTLLKGESKDDEVLAPVRPNDL